MFLKVNESPPLLIAEEISHLRNRLRMFWKIVLEEARKELGPKK
jgi:hypothetical protein